MQKGITLFMAVYAVLILASGGAYLAAADNPQVAQFAGIGLALLVFGLAFIAHKTSDAIGNPFNGLILGKFKHLFFVWIGGLLLGSISVGLAIGLGFTGIDPDMTAFLTMAAEQASQGGNAVSASDMAGMKVFFMVIGVAGALVGSFLTAAFISLAFYPVYGWLGRRLLVKGLSPTFMVLAIFGLIGTAISALAPNPLVQEPNMLIAMPVGAVYGVALTAVCLWLFLMTNSAVVPALAVATFQGAMGSFQMFFGGAQAHLAPPMGVSDLIVLILVAIGLWSIKVPDSKHMEVAAVAFDGTSLTSAEVASLDERRQREGDASESIGEAATESEPPTAPPPPAG